MNVEQSNLQRHNTGFPQCASESSSRGRSPTPQGCRFNALKVMAGWAAMMLKVSMKVTEQHTTSPEELVNTWQNVSSRNITHQKHKKNSKNLEYVHFTCERSAVIVQSMERGRRKRQDSKIYAYINNFYSI